MRNKKISYLSNSLKDFLDDAGFKNSIKSIPEIKNVTNVMSTIGITGDKVGFLTLSVDLDNAVKVSKSFAELMEIPIASDEFSDTHLEALSELSNQIAGRVVMFMEKNEINCSITPPTVLSGGDISISVQALSHKECFKIKGKYGYFFITIGIK